jgi:hypothetical protein
MDRSRCSEAAVDLAGFETMWDLRAVSGEGGGRVREGWRRTGDTTCVFRFSNELRGRFSGSHSNEVVRHGNPTLNHSLTFAEVWLKVYCV